MTNATARYDDLDLTSAEDRAIYAVARRHPCDHHRENTYEPYRRQRALTTTRTYRPVAGGRARTGLFLPRDGEHGAQEATRPT